MSIFGITTWIVGGIDGLKHREGGLDSSIVYGTTVISSAWGILHGISKASSPPVRTSAVLSPLVVVPIAIGSIYYVGHLLGRGMSALGESKS